MKKEYFVNKESVEKLYKIAYDYCARKDLEGLKKSFESSELEIDKKNPPQGWTLLMTAAYFDFYMAVDFLIKQGASIDMVEESGATALLGAVSNDALSCVQKLLKAGANVNLGNKNGFTPLMSACYNGNQQMVEIILDKSPEIMQQDESGKTALQYAVDSDNFAVVNIIERNVIEKKIALNPHKAKSVVKI